MKRPMTFTVVFTLIGLALVAYHAFGLDHDHIVLFLFSIPAWIIPFFTPIMAFNKYALYILTVLSWALIGYGIDWLIAKSRAGAWSDWR